MDKRGLPTYIGAEQDLYRLAFWRLLEEIEILLTHLDQPGMLLVDARSDLHSSVQDRRLVDAYREWNASQTTKTHIVELPWFGFSKFYAGLQLADFTAYLIDFITNEALHSRRSEELHDAFVRLEGKIRVVHIP